MKQKLFIRNTTAAFLLVLFVFGSTPKLFLHNLVANHKDDIGITKVTGTQIAKTPVYCHCDNLVVESPFEAEMPQAAMHLRLPTPFFNITILKHSVYLITLILPFAAHPLYFPEHKRLFTRICGFFTITALIFYINIYGNTARFLNTSS